MSNRIPLPPPALTQHPSGNVYFSPQQMQEHADKVRAQALADGYDFGFAASKSDWNGESPQAVWTTELYISVKKGFLEEIIKAEK